MGAICYGIKYKVPQREKYFTQDKYYSEMSRRPPCLDVIGSSKTNKGVYYLLLSVFKRYPNTNTMEEWKTDIDTIINFHTDMCLLF